eukprot:7141600-Alexandrium_andersonii.AAC.1
MKQKLNLFWASMRQMPGTGNEQNIAAMVRWSAFLIEAFCLREGLRARTDTPPFFLLAVARIGVHGASSSALWSCQPPARP